MKNCREFSRKVSAPARTSLFMYTLLFIAVVYANPEPGAIDSGFELTTPDTDRVKLGAVLERDETGMIVQGYLMRQPLSKGPIHGHVDVAVTAKTGELILADSVRIRPNPIPQKTTVRSRFTWRVPPQVAWQSRIELRFHSGPHTTR